MNELTIAIYTDGACSGNPGPGGYGAVLVATDVSGRVVKELEVSGGEAETTNNRMELRAAIAGLSALTKASVASVVSDSEYLVNTMTKGWKRKKNLDLWAELDAQTAKHEISWQYVRGHAGHPYNERCDRLAVAEIAQFKKRSRATE
ncbi:MAG TPA: ribonuclease HI [Candidatus Limnocylindrales bacterium]|nr:ribonuclease HI [Candidatus Limnocylindrales bacterium]